LPIDRSMDGSYCCRCRVAAGWVLPELVVVADAEINLNPIVSANWDTNGMTFVVVATTTRKGNKHKYSSFPQAVGYQTQSTTRFHL
jgi:hypothetical protein